MSQWICEAPLDLFRLLSETEDAASGAVVVFCGTVRNENEGRPVESMTYEAHVSLAEKALRAIEQEAVTKFHARRCRIQHRIGHLQLGELSVAIVVWAGHRAEAYEASRYAIDEVKRRAPIWKEEHYLDGQSRFLDGIPLTGSEEAAL